MIHTGLNYWSVEPKIIFGLRDQAILYRLSIEEGRLRNVPIYVSQLEQDTDAVERDSSIRVSE